MDSLETALAHLEAVVKGNPLGTPGGNFGSPAGQVEVAGGLDPNPGETKTVVKAVDETPEEKEAREKKEKEAKEKEGKEDGKDEEEYDLGEEEEEGLHKGLSDYFGDALEKGLTGVEGGESPLVTLVKALDLYTGDVTNAIGAQFQAMNPINEALIKGLAATIQRTDSQTDLIKGLVDSFDDLTTRLEHTTAELVKLGGQPVPKKSLQAGQQVLEKGMPGEQPVGSGAANPANLHAGDPFHGLGKAEVLRKAIVGHSKNLIPIEAVQGIDRVGLSQEHFDLVKAL